MIKFIRALFASLVAAINEAINEPLDDDEAQAMRELVQFLNAHEAN